MHYIPEVRRAQGGVRTPLPVAPGAAAPRIAAASGSRREPRTPAALVCRARISCPPHSQPSPLAARPAPPRPPCPGARRGGGAARRARGRGAQGLPPHGAAPVHLRGRRPQCLQRRRVAGSALSRSAGRRKGRGMRAVLDAGHPPALWLPAHVPARSSFPCASAARCLSARSVPLCIVHSILACHQLFKRCAWQIVAAWPANGVAGALCSTVLPKAGMRSSKCSASGLTETSRGGVQQARGARATCAATSAVIPVGLPGARWPQQRQRPKQVRRRRRVQALAPAVQAQLGEVL